MPELGVSQEHAIEFSDRVDAASGEVGFVRTYVRDGAWSSGQFSSTRAAHVRGQKVIVSVKLPQGATMASVSAGQNDAHYRGIAEGLAGYGLRDGYFSFFHEPEDDIERGDFTAIAYRAAANQVYKVVGPILRPLGWKMSTILMGWTLDNRSGRNVSDYWVSEADAIGWDIYNKGDAGDPPKPAFMSNPPTQYVNSHVAQLKRARDYTESNGRVPFIGEYGVGRRLVDTAGTERTNALKLTRDQGGFDGFTVLAYYEDGVMDNRAEYAVRNEPRSLDQLVFATAAPEVHPCSDLAEEVRALQVQVQNLELTVTSLTTVNRVLSEQATNQADTIAGLQLAVRSKDAINETLVDQLRRIRDITVE
jgi:hypothetical protein